jgi:hypothetical protein
MLFVDFIRDRDSEFFNESWNHVEAQIAEQVPFPAYAVACIFASLLCTNSDCLVQRGLSIGTARFAEGGERAVGIFEPFCGDAYFDNN